MMRHCCAVAGFAIAVLAGCHQGAPSTPKEQASLEAKASSALQAMRAKDPGIDSLISSAAGYAVFPDVGAAGALYVGGAYGKGVLFEGGRPTGFVTLTQGGVGLTLGGQSYAELIVLPSPQDVAKMKGGNFSLGAGITAVVVKPGAAAEARTAATPVLVDTHGGLMAGVTVNGQQINFAPAG